MRDSGSFERFNEMQICALFCFLLCVNVLFPFTEDDRGFTRWLYCDLHENFIVKINLKSVFWFKLVLSIDQKEYYNVKLDKG